MIKKIFLIFTLSILLLQSKSQVTGNPANSAVSSDSVTYDLFGEAHALMCPFLSPQLIAKLKLEGAENFHRTSDYHLLFRTNQAGFISDSRILDLVEKTGYERNKFVISHGVLND
jgi:hypothetical protein